MNPVKVFVYGHEAVGWSIDADYKHTCELLEDAGFQLTKNPLNADTIHFGWWNQICMELLCSRLALHYVVIFFYGSQDSTNLLFKR